MSGVTPVRRLLVLEPYFGGSHRAVLEVLLPALESYGWRADVLTLPARKWKWRMRGAAMTMASETARLHDLGARWDVVFASTFVNLAEFVALAGDAVAGVPRVVYFHENQLLYPNRHTAEWDLQFPLTNITSALVADLCLFNTRWNKDGFLREIPPFLRQFPDHHPKGVVERIAAKSEVLPPPFDPALFDAAPVTRGECCRIVWPHRWEHDKAPEPFFAAVTRLAEEGLDFEVAVAGQPYPETRASFETAAVALGSRLVYIGAPESRSDYAALLASADVAVSTADNEFFGLAMIEAAYAGCFPLVPDRLAYPELYDAPMRYASNKDLVGRLRRLVVERPAPGQCKLIAERYTIGTLAPAYAEVLGSLSHR
jgi:glycosyltransferase involved in cell wall biosynthesis